MDREVVLRARDGDHEAFAAIAGASIGRLTGVARLILHDEDRALDAVQDALVDAWRGIRGLHDPDRVDAWLYRLLVRACYSRAKRDSRRSVTEIRMTPAVEPTGLEPQRSIDTRDQLERGLRSLPTDQRAVLVLTYYLDLPLNEAAQVLGVPLGTVKSRLDRARRGLRAAIDAGDRDTGLARERFA